MRHSNPCKDFPSLFQRAKSGDKAAEEQLFVCIGERFDEYHGHKIRRKEDLRDLQQEVCLVVLPKYKTEIFTKGFEFWLAGVMSNVLNRFWERRMKEGRLGTAMQSNPGLVPKPVDLSLDPELKRRLIRCLELMCRTNRRYARTVCLIYHDKSVADIAKTLDTTRNNVYTILSRGRDRLWDCLWSCTI